MSEKQEQKVNRPKGDSFRQQKLQSWQPIMTPLKVVVLFFAIGIAFIPTGTTLLGNSNDIYESIVTYDGDDADVDCSISTANQGKTCKVSNCQTLTAVLQIPHLYSCWILTDIFHLFLAYLQHHRVCRWSSSCLLRA